MARPADPRPAAAGGRAVSYAFRPWKIRTYKGRRGTTYAVRWVVAGVEFHDTFATIALAESRRAELVTAARNGEPFDVELGVPVSELGQVSERVSERTWYEHAVGYVNRRWDNAAGNSRQSIAETLATVTPVLLDAAQGRPDDKILRRALYGWAFNKQRRESAEPYRDIARALAWAERNSRPVSDLADTEVMLDILDAIARKLDGKPAAANTVARKRAVLHNVLEHAVGRGLDVNPLPAAAKLWTQPTATEVVDPQVVVNRRQADALLAAVGEQGETGRRLVAFFGCLYYAGQRPGGAVALREPDLRDIPEQGWGTFYLRKSAPSVGRAWTDSGQRRDRRQLKHRAIEEVRPVPCPAQLTRLIRAHITEFGFTPDGRLFCGVRGGDLSESVYGRIWQAARLAALTPAEAASPLAGRPYDLRHACLSTWLNGGVDPTQVAEWAGNSVAVLLRVYAKCIAGRDKIARQRIEEALRDNEYD
jgi:integrase